MIEKTLFEFLFCVIDIILLAKYCDTVFIRRFNNFIITWITILIFSFFVFISSFIFSFLSSIIIWLIFVTYSVLIYEGKLLSRVMKTSIYFFLYGIISLLLLSFVSTIFGIDMSKFIVEIYLLRVLYTMFSRLVIYILLMVLAKKINKEMNNEYYHQTTIGIFMVACTVLLIILYDILLNAKVNFDSNNIFMLGVAIIMMVLCLFQISKSYLNLKLENKQIKIALEANDLQQQAYLEKAKTDVEIMIVKHDLKNMLLSMSYLLNEGKIDEAKEMLEQSSSNIVFTKIIDTNSDILNALLNVKIRENPSIKFNTHIDIDKLEISSIDLSSLLGNSLDNAIEAVDKVKDREKEVYIEIKEEYNIIYIMVKNTYDKRPEKQGSRFLTYKHDKKNHGLGIMSMERIAEKYDGELNISLDDDYFKIEIYLFPKTI